MCIDFDVVDLTVSEVTDDLYDCLFDRHDSDFAEEDEVVQPNNEEAGFNYLYW